MEIEWFKDGKSLYKTTLPNGSTETLRKELAIKGGVKNPDRYTISKDGEIKVDSDNTFVEQLQKELNNI